MSLTIDRSLRRLLVALALFLLSAVIIGQIAVYWNSEWIKNEILQHDYNLAGALLKNNPELAGEIRSAFTTEKTAGYNEKGRELLEQSGYKLTAQTYLISEASKFKQNNIITCLVFFILLGIVILYCVYLYAVSQNRKIEQYSTDIQKIMSGDTDARLKDSDEGSLPKLAASINQLVTSLNAHIEKEKQSRLFLKDIIANISHQLKTPLSALSMYMEIMKEEQVENEVVTDFLSKSENELERMRSLTANLLKLAKLDAGIIVLNKGVYSINRIVAKAAESLMTRLEKEGKSFAVISEGQANYNCDLEWMLEAFSNLIKNAAEHTSAGDRIEVAIQESPLLVKVIFSDNGEGIHREDINHIFKRFYRSRFSQNKQGTGIGLTLVKSVIDLHGGYITVDSTLNKGSVFTINLPKLTNQ